MATKTLTQLRSSVRNLYGDPYGTTAVDADVDAFLKDGIDRVLNDCPWLSVTLDATESFTTDAVGAAEFDIDFEIQQIYSLEVTRSSGSWERIDAVPAGQLNVNITDVTGVDSVIGYYMDGSRITFYPMYRSQAIVVRLVYSSGTIGAGFPASGSDKLPPGIPRAAEEAAIRHAVQQFHARDNNFEAAGFISQDVENWIMRCKIAHNRSERGETTRVYDRNSYSLEFDY